MDGIQGNPNYRNFGTLPKRYMQPSLSSIDRYIDSTVDVSELIAKKYEKTTVSHYNIYSVNPLFFSSFFDAKDVSAFHNNETEAQRVATAFTLQTFFTGRTDKYATQNKVPNARGRCSYHAQNPSKSISDLIFDHIDGKETCGFYCIDENDMCHYACADLDDHEMVNPQLDEVRKLVDFCESKNIPVLVEASGSPNSFHVWIPIIPAKTYTVYKFMKQLIHDSGVKCKETFPKQKSLATCGRGYGNFVKMPLGINRTSGVRSYFLDPKTLQPVKSIIISKVLKLCELEIVEETEEVIASTSTELHSKLPDGFRPCLKAALEKNLVGPDGHLTRVAIASEAFRCGFSVEEAVVLFQGQSDFNYNTTRVNLQYFYDKGYHRFGCDKLRTECQMYIDCSNCTCNVQHGMAESTA